MQNTPDQLCRAALAVLIVLQFVMLAALFTKTPPHPPIAVAPFALGPFLGGSLSIAIASFFLGSAATGGGRAAALIAGILALVSFGPQKWIDPAIAQIWPAVLLGEIAVLLLAAGLVRAARH